MNHQSTFQGAQPFGAGQNRYQPAGFVQSQYQGQLSRSAASGPVTAKFGYQAGQQSFGQQQPVVQQPVGQQSFASSGPQHPVYSATNAYQQEGPVIQRLGYLAGAQQQTFRQPSGQQSFSGQAGMTGFASQQQTQHPVYRATNAYQQEGPVIQHLGYQAGVQEQQFLKPSGQQSFSGQAGMTQASQQQTQHPVYRATNAYQQEGPVIQHAGYQAGPSGLPNRFSF